jgi:diacylglycerol kinase
MACCIVLAALLGLIGWPVRRLMGRRASPLAWRLHPAPVDAIGRRRFRLADRARSFGYAFAGLGFLIRNEHNAWLHMAASVAIVAAGAMLRLNLADWRWIIVAITWVWTAEALNTAIEQLCNLVSPDPHPLIKSAKDVAAAAVLVSAAGAALIGATVFLPYLPHVEGLFRGHNTNYGVPN